MKNKVDIKKLKASKKAHKKAFNDLIVLKGKCPIDKGECLIDCDKVGCKK